MKPEIKAIKIDVHNKTVSEVVVRNDFKGTNGMYEHMKTDMIEHGAYIKSDILLVDEEGNFKNGNPAFTYRNRPFVGNALLVGAAGENYGDVKIDLAEVQDAVEFF